MKNRSACVKCDSVDLRKIPGNFPLSEASNSAKVGVFKKMYVTRFVCIECGYSEEWIEKKQDLEYLRKKADQPDDFSNFV